MARLSSAPTAVVVTDSPSWLPAPGQFASVSLANATSVDPCPDQRCRYSGTEGFASLWTVWNGGVYASALGAMGSMLFFGGGHFSYDGNHVIAYDVATRRWSRLNEPGDFNTYASGDSNATNVLVDADGSFPDGTPYPNHTNMGCEYLPPEAGGGRLGSYVFVGHEQTGVRIAHSNLWLFDLERRSWTRWRLPVAGANLLSICYDSNRRGLWYCNADRITSYFSKALYFLDVAARTMTQVGVNSRGAKMGDITYLPGLTYLPSNDCLVLPRNGKGLDLTCIELAGLAPKSDEWAPMYNINQAGPKARSLWTHPDGDATADNKYLNCAASDRLEFCQRDGALYAPDLESSGPCKLHRLAPPASGSLQSGTWTWTTETLTARAGERFALRNLPYLAKDDRRLFGRFRFVPAASSFLVSDASDLPVQALRPDRFGS